MPIQVSAYSGYKANERPLDEQTYEISTIEDRWYEPEAEFFKVLTIGGKQSASSCGKG